MTDPLSILQRAEGYFELDNPQEAWDTLEDLPAEAKASKRVLHLRLRILMSLKEWQKAGYMAESLITCAEPDNPTLWYDFSICLAEQQLIEDAKKALKKCLELDPELREWALLDPRLNAVW